MYQVDAFTNEVFKGNPAAVCVLYDAWLPEQIMQNIAAENNLSETAFVLTKDMSIRWFTPVSEIDLCGHATLATAHVLFFHEGVDSSEITFMSKKGELIVSKEPNSNGMLCLNFPCDVIKQIEFEDKHNCFNYKPKEIWQGTEEYLLIYETEEQVREAVCDLKKAKEIDLSGFIITAQANNTQNIDFVSRYFTPKYGIDEDPVTGSAHTLLIPYWHQKTGKTKFNAKQVSKRGGDLFCTYAGSRVLISGHAVTFFKGEILTC
jgi:PhzF family phenazine biosynthesis protein